MFLNAYPFFDDNESVYSDNYDQNMLLINK